VRAAQAKLPDRTLSPGHAPHTPGPIASAARQPSPVHVRRALEAVQAKLPAAAARVRVPPSAVLQPALEDELWYQYYTAPATAPAPVESKLRAAAPSFTPPLAVGANADRDRVEIYKSHRYRGDAGQVNELANYLARLQWPRGVTRVYLTNGIHEGFEGGGPVSYFGYAMNEDLDTAKQHWYL
jgi:hypothetical protein